MKLKLPNNDNVNLDTNLPLEDKKRIVNEILLEWEGYFEESWELNKTKVFLEVLSNYLCYAKEKENKNKEDKYIMSATKIKHMEKGNKKSSNFSNLPQEHKQLLGLVDFKDDESGE